MDQRILRTIDANINRISEGLRVLEDISRFIIEDADSTQQLKSVRHLLNNMVSPIGHKLLIHRDVTGDIGAGSDITKEHKDLISITRANSKRVQEGLRVLEELSKLAELINLLPTEKLKNSRYQIYSVEKAMITHLTE